TGNFSSCRPRSADDFPLSWNWGAAAWGSLVWFVMASVRGESLLVRVRLVIFGALLQGGFSRLHVPPDLLLRVPQVTLLFAPAYLVLRGVKTITSRSKFGGWMHQ
ncbi:MAG: hypothetical protein ABJB66_08475, partial [Gemmatimonadaceae bacterium]